MFEKSAQRTAASEGAVEREPAPSDKDETARILALALEDVRLARVRAQKRTRVVGVHGTDFEDRDTRVEQIVEKFTARVVKTARKNALRAGWTKAQLAELERHSEHDSGNARA